MDSIQDADPQSHERFGEINHLLPLRGDGETSNRQVCFLQRKGGKRQSCNEKLCVSNSRHTVSVETKQEDGTEKSLLSWLCTTQKNKREQQTH